MTESPPEGVLPPNVIRLSEAKSAWLSGRCQHLRVEVDGVLAECSCLDCGAKLDPIGVLVRYAKEESRLSWLLDRQRQLAERLEAKQRCKCQHCGRFTTVRP